MSSVRGGRAAVVESLPESSPAPRAAGTAAMVLPTTVEAQVERSLRATLDAARFPLTRLVRSVAERLTARPSAVPFAALEGEVHATVLALGRDLLSELVRLRGTGSRGPSYVCPCGVRLVFKERAPLQQRTWFGTITLERAVYAGAGCHERAHHVPLDAQWALLGVAPAPTVLPDPDGGGLVAAPPGAGPARLAPAFAAVVAEFGARLPYAEAARLLERACGTVAHLSPTTVGAYAQAAGQARVDLEDAQRVRTTPPSRAERRAVFDQPAQARPGATPETLVISMDGALERTDAGWKEVKLGAVYTLVHCLRRVGGEATAVVEAGVTTYTATLAAAQTFARQLVAVAQRRGLGWADQVVVLGDGAKWIWKLADRRFPRAVQIVDWFHAREHLWALAQLLHGEGTTAAHAWCETLAGLLWSAHTVMDIDVLAQAADEAWTTPAPVGSPDLDDTPVPRRTAARRRTVDRALAYFTGNATRLRYGAFRDQDLPVGSGVVEGGCQSVLHARLKRPGACWSPAAAEAMGRRRGHGPCPRRPVQRRHPRVPPPPRPARLLTPGTTGYTRRQPPTGTVDLCGLP